MGRPFIYREGVSVPKSVTHVEIDPKTRRIEQNAFQDCESLHEIVIPEGVIEIGKKAFQNCESLKSIRLPDSLTSIGEGAFRDCSKLKKVTIPQKIKYIEYRAFAFCDNLVIIKLPKGLKSIEEDAFSNCENLASIRLPDSLTSIGKGAFTECFKLVSLNLPDSITSIGSYAFSSCSSLTRIKLPKNLTSLGRKAFLDCKSICSVTFPRSLKEVKERTFSGCSKLISIILMNSLLDLGEEAFRGCKNLLNIIISEKPTTDYVPNNSSLKVGRDCFKECSKLLKRSSRFEQIPLHSICSTVYEAPAGNLAEKIRQCIQKYPGCAEKKDQFSSTPLHILALNPSVTKECLEIVIEAHPKALFMKDDNGMLPQHLLLLNPNISADLFIPCILNAKTMHDKFANSIRNGYHYSVAAFAIYLVCNEEVQQLLYSHNPVERDVFRNSNEWYIDQLDKIEKKYQENIKERSKNKKWSFLDAHGWVQFLDIFHEYDSSEIINFIKSDECDSEHAHKLIFAKDHHNRVAMNVASKGIQEAMKQKIYFLGRYDIKNGSTLHESDTCIVMRAKDMKSDEFYSSIFTRFKGSSGGLTKKHQAQQALEYLGLKNNDFKISKFTEAFNEDQNHVIKEGDFLNMCKDILDDGQNRTVAMKFMKNKDQFERELDVREKLNEDPMGYHYFIDIDDHHDLEKEGCKPGKFAKELEPYEFLLVMSFADRDLEEIIRSERPNEEVKRAYVLDLLGCLKYIHGKGIVHGDLKPSNIVRFGDRLCMIDFDAASYIGQETANSQKESKYYTGKKFSSGSLPPEMMFEFKESDHPTKFREYFKEIENKFIDFEKKIEPKETTFSHRFFAIKSFLTKEDETEENAEMPTTKQVEVVKITDDLPFEPVKATTAIDMWALGTCLYYMYTGETLFDLNINGDLKDGNAMKELHDWKVTENDYKLDKVKDKNMKKLLISLLSEHPEERGSLTDARNIIDQPLANESNGMDKHVNMKFEIMLRSIFEAKSMNIPTSFIILPCLKDEIKDENNEIMDIGKEVMKELMKPHEKTNIWDKLFKKKSPEKYYLYLMDEYDYSIADAEPQGPYPIEIDKSQKEVLKVMSILLITVKFKERQEFMKYIDDYFRSQEPTSASEKEARITLGRGSILKEYEAFLLAKDENREFSNLIRVHNPDNGKAMWVSEASFEKMEKDKSGYVKDLSDTIYRKELQEKTKELNNQILRNTMLQDEFDQVKESLDALMIKKSKKGNQDLFVCF